MTKVTVIETARPGANGLNGTVSFLDMKGDVFSSTASSNTPNTVSPATKIDDTSFILTAGTWDVTVRWSAIMFRDVATAGSQVAFVPRRNGAEVATVAYDYLVPNLRQSIQHIAKFTGLTGVQTFGLRYRGGVVAGTTWIASAFIDISARRTS